MLADVAGLEGELLHADAGRHDVHPGLDGVDMLECDVGRTGAGGDRQIVGKEREGLLVGRIDDQLAGMLLAVEGRIGIRQAPLEIVDRGVDHHVMHHLAAIHPVVEGDGGWRQDGEEEHDDGVAIGIDGGDVVLVIVSAHGEVAVVEAKDVALADAVGEIVDRGADDVEMEEHHGVASRLIVGKVGVVVGIEEHLVGNIPMVLVARHGGEMGGIGAEEVEPELAIGGTARDVGTHQHGVDVESVQALGEGEMDAVPEELMAGDGCVDDGGGGLDAGVPQDAVGTVDIREGDRGPVVGVGMAETIDGVAPHEAVAHYGVADHRQGLLSPGGDHQQKHQESGYVAKETHYLRAMLALKKSGFSVTSSTTLRKGGIWISSAGVLGRLSISRR